MPELFCLNSGVVEKTKAPPYLFPAAGKILNNSRRLPYRQFLGRIAGKGQFFL